MGFEGDPSLVGPARAGIGAGASGHAGESARGSGAHAAADALIHGDVVRVRIGSDPGLSGDFGVDENGMVALPRLGRIAAAGEPAALLRERIVRGYTALLVHSSVEVTLLRRVQVLGAVRNPGPCLVDAAMTVDDVLAQAGGATSAAHPGRVVLVHPDGGGSVVARRTRIGDTALRGGDELFVLERGSLHRNVYVLMGTLTAVLYMATVLSNQGRMDEP